jgi:hypothetical protein
LLGDAKSSLGDAKSSLGDAESSLGDAKSSLGDAKSSLRDASSELGRLSFSERMRNALGFDERVPGGAPCRNRAETPCRAGC